MLLRSKERSPSRLRWYDFLAVSLHRLGPWLILALALYFLRDVVLALTSRQSLPAAWIVLMSSVKATRVFALAFGALGILYGLQQRNLRRAAEERWRKRIAQLESWPAREDSTAAPRS